MISGKICRKDMFTHIITVYNNLSHDVSGSLNEGSYPKLKKLLLDLFYISIMKHKVADSNLRTVKLDNIIYFLKRLYWILL